MAQSDGIGRRIKELREARDWTQSELGRLSGQSQSNINLIESGKRTQLKNHTIVAIASAFRVSTDELLGYDKDAIREPVGADAVKRIDALEQGLLRVNERVAKGFEDVLNRLDGQPRAASKPRRKQSQRKRS